tara:strand:+ start:1217 stop:1390 length:174 start_codon:yes stop_codon:yes gene_type:complete
MILINQNISRYRSNGGTLIGKIENRVFKKRANYLAKKRHCLFFLFNLSTQKPILKKY